MFLSFQSSMTILRGSYLSSSSRSEFTLKTYLRVLTPVFCTSLMGSYLCCDPVGVATPMGKEESEDETELFATDQEVANDLIDRLKDSVTEIPSTKEPEIEKPLTGLHDDKGLYSQNRRGLAFGCEESFEGTRQRSQIVFNQQIGNKGKKV